MAGNGKTINSNVTGVSVAEEATIGVLPAAPVWYNRPVVSYSDFGGDISFVADDSINPSRQNQRGLPVGIEAAGGYNLLMTNGLTRDMQGFFFANSHEKASTAPLNGTAITITGVNGAGAYTAAAGLTAFSAGMLVMGAAFTNSGNNVVSEVTGVTATTLTTDAPSVAEASPPADAHVQQVGLAFGSGDLSLTVTGGLATLSSTAGDWGDLNVQVGEWIFIGGDAAGQQFASGYGYGRVSSVDANDVVIDEIAWIGTIADSGGAGKSVHVYAGTYTRNEKDPALIKCRSYNVERTLGPDDDGTQSEYLEGAFANELVLNIPVKDRHTADFSYVALDNSHRTGLEGVKSGEHVQLPKQTLYNTSSTVFRLRMSLLDADTLDPTELFAYASAATININNNAAVVEAIGAFGGVDVSVGNFVVSGSITAYFTTVESIKAIRDNADVGFNTIMAQDNKGLVYDIPLMGVGGGRLTVEKDQPITVPIENFGAENPNGYTASHTSFEYLPDVAMPV